MDHGRAIRHQARLGASTSLALLIARPVSRLLRVGGLGASVGGVQAFEDEAHLGGVVLFFLVSLVLFVVDHVLLRPVLELGSLLLPAESRGRHDAHDLLVVVQDRQSRQFGLVTEERAVSIGRALKLLVRVPQSTCLRHGAAGRGVRSVASLDHAELVDLGASVEVVAPLEIAMKSLGHGRLVAEVVKSLLIVVLVLHVAAHAKLFCRHALASLGRVRRDEIVVELGLFEWDTLSISVEDSLSCLLKLGGVI